MPPKPKFTGDQIVAAALNIVSAEGIEGLTAQRLSRELGSSASPIFTVFDNMKEIQDRVRQAAMAKFEAGGPHSPGMPAFKEIGMKLHAALHACTTMNENGVQCSASSVKILVHGTRSAFFAATSARMKLVLLSC